MRSTSCPLRSIALVIEILTILLALCPPLPACQICYPIPKQSAADHLIAAEVVITARENPEKPFHLVPVKALKGDPSGKPIDLFLDSRTRRVLADNPEQGVLCVYQPAGEKPGWRRIGLVNEVVGAIVDEILKRAPAWKEDPKARSSFFAPFLGHEDNQMRTLAHIEVARAPYDELRKLGAALPREEIRAFLGNIRYLEWHPLYILLLAQSDEEQDHQLVAEKIRTAQRFALTTNLAAWATAFIEVEGEPAIEHFETQYLQNPNRTAKELQEILMALSVQGSRGRPELRDRIVESYRLVLKHQRSFAPQVLNELVKWERWELADTAGELIDAPPADLERATLVQLRAYVNQAGRMQTVEAIVDPVEREGEPGSFFLIFLTVALIALPVLLIGATKWKHKK